MTTSGDGEQVAGEPVDLGRIADALEGAGDEIRHRNEHLTEMGQAITALVISTDALVVAVKGSQQRNRQFRWLVGLGVALMLTGIITAVVLGVRLNRIASENHSTNQLIASCVTPTGKCAKAGDTRTAAALAELEQRTLEEDVAADLCARNPANDTYQAILTCARRKLGQ